MSLAPPRILLCADADVNVDATRAALESGGFEVAFYAIGVSRPAEADIDLAIIDGAEAGDEALALCRVLRSRQDESFFPILFADGELSVNRLASLQAGADGYLQGPFTRDELLAHAHALLRIKERHDRLAAKSSELQHVHKRLATAYHQIDLELQLAGRIQEGFLPRSLPDLPKARFAVSYRPCSRVGGDFYDAFRLDEHHLGFYVADAMGHGVPASLLTIFVKQGVKAKEINGKEYRLVPPDEVLRNLNRDLIAQALAETPFITMVYALLDMRDGSFQFARAGHPYPLYLPRYEPARLWQVEGSLLGVFETDYRLIKRTLHPGDRVLLYTDGMDAAGFEKRPVGSASLLAAAEHHRDLSIGDLVQRLSSDLFGETARGDDLTLLGLEYLAGPEEARPGSIP